MHYYYCFFFTKNTNFLHGITRKRTVHGIFAWIAIFFYHVKYILAQRFSKDFWLSVSVIVKAHSKRECGGCPRIAAISRGGHVKNRLYDIILTRPRFSVIVRVSSEYLAWWYTKKKMFIVRNMVLLLFQYTLYIYIYGMLCRNRNYSINQKVWNYFGWDAAARNDCNESSSKIKTTKHVCSYNNNYFNTRVLIIFFNCWNKTPI